MRFLVTGHKGFVGSVGVHPVDAVTQQRLHREFITVDELEGWRCPRIGQIKQLMESGRLGPDLRWT